MTDEKFVKELTVENYKEYILNLERQNLRDITKEDKKVMVSKIIRHYEEAKKNADNKC